jgi:ribonuclease VapC
MVIDSSAVLAILQQETDAGAMANAIAAAPVRLFSAVSLLETGILTRSRKGDAGAHELDAFVEAARLEIVPFDEAQAQVAREAFARFGKRRHPANLNFGDCAVYALAATRGELLLCKGKDFAATDLALCTLA